jgi:hypothetical protein
LPKSKWGLSSAEAIASSNVTTGDNYSLREERQQISGPDLDSEMSLSYHKASVFSQIEHLGKLISVGTRAESTCILYGAPGEQFSG